MIDFTIAVYVTLTRFLSSDMPRNAQPAAVATDAINFLDALRIQKVLVAGFDWGGRTANLMAFLWPERCKASGFPPLRRGASCVVHFRRYVAIPRFCRTNHLESSMSRRGNCRDNAVAESSRAFIDFPAGRAGWVPTAVLQVPLALMCGRRPIATTGLGQRHGAF
jgi:pimeloyl-ACP methyl ester carboxylesterase